MAFNDIIGNSHHSLIYLYLGLLPKTNHQCLQDLPILSLLEGGDVISLQEFCAYYFMPFINPFQHILIIMIKIQLLTLQVNLVLNVEGPIIWNYKCMHDSLKRIVQKNIKLVLVLYLPCLLPPIGFDFISLWNMSKCDGIQKLWVGK